MQRQERHLSSHDMLKDPLLLLGQIRQLLNISAL